MARLQILELPEAAGDERAPFVLVVDQCAPQRFVLGMGDAPVRDYWHEVANRIGARGVIVTAETVEIPANEVTIGPDGYPVRLRVEADLDGFREQVAGALGLVQSETDRMDAVTGALGFDRLRDWGEIVSAIKRQRQIAADGEHVFGEPGYQDPQRCAQCGLDRSSWIMRRDTRTCSTVRADAESGHEFRPIGARDELACLRCGMPRIEWAVRRDTPQCDVVRQGGE